jgi:hypothetical protein
MEVRENRAGSRPKQTAREHLEELLDEALMATFPASDPIAVGRQFLEVLEQQPDRRVARADAEGGEGARPL